MISIKKLVEDRDTRYGRLFDIFIQILIGISIISFSIETLPNLSERTLQVLGLIEMTTVIIFTVEY